MIKQTISGFGMASALLVTGCASTPEKSVEIAMPTEVSPVECVANYLAEPVSDSRKATAESAISSAAKLAGKVALPEVTAVADFLQTRILPNGADALPTPTGISLVAIEKARSFDCHPLSTFAVSSAFGYYDEESKTILISDKTEPVSELWGGLLMLHESRHARNDHEGHSDPLEERNTRVFEQSILSRVGGQVYDALIDQLKIKVVEFGFSKSGNYAIDSARVIDAIDQPALNKIFGPIVSETDERIRRTDVAIHAIFEAIAEHDSINAPALQQRFMDLNSPEANQSGPNG